MTLPLLRWTIRAAPALVGMMLSTPSAASTRWLRPAATRDFAVIRPELQRLADRQGRARVNHFCAVVRDTREPPSAISEGDARVLIVHWREGRRIDSYGPPSDGRLTAEQADAGASIDLARDVVATPAQVDGSIKRVARATVRALIAHCRAHGTDYVIIPRGHRA